MDGSQQALVGRLGHGDRLKTSFNRGGQNVIADVSCVPILKVSEMVITGNTNFWTWKRNTRPPMICNRKL